MTDRYIYWPLGPKGAMVPIRHKGPLPSQAAYERKCAELRRAK